MVDYLIHSPEGLPSRVSELVEDLNETWRQFEVATGHDPTDPDAPWIESDVEVRAYLRHESIDMPFESEKVSRRGLGMTFVDADLQANKLAGLRDAVLIVHDAYDRTMGKFGEEILEKANKVHEDMLDAKNLVESANADDIKNGTVNPTPRLQGLSEDLHRQLLTLHNDIMDYAGQFQKWQSAIEEMVGDPATRAAEQLALQQDRQNYLRNRFGVTKDAHGNERLEATEDKVVADAVSRGQNVLFGEDHFDPLAASRVRDQLEKNLSGVRGLAYELPQELWPAYRKYFEEDHDLAALQAVAGTPAHVPAFMEAYSALLR